MTSKKLLLIDTNIISHALSTNQAQCYIDLFRELEVIYIFVVTGFTKYELLRSSDKQHKIAIADYIEQNMVRVDLSDVLMSFSARVFYLYSKDKTTKNLKISDGDIINAAFSIAKDCAVLTIDNNDLPRTFFTELSRHRMTYMSKGSKKETTDVAYIVTPDIDHIKLRFHEYNI
jgi:predicted nucleic acid-binding protein